jgi:hypothetical protein
MHILAPVPAVHLPSAEETFRREGRVAFGSNAWEFWRKQTPGAATVWIVASATGFPAVGLPGIDPGKLIFRGTYAGMVDARRGVHPTPALRPASTGTDGAWAMFFELTDLARLAPPRSVIGIVMHTGTRLARVPEGPIAIRDPEEPAP